MTWRRSKNLQPKDVELIVSLFDGWSGPLAWERVIDAVELRLCFRYTRQALSRHQQIQNAFMSCKERLEDAPYKRTESKPMSPALRAVQERLAKRDVEVMRLKAENQRLMEKFVVWLYNAQIRGVSQVELERPMPCVNRGQTKQGLRRLDRGT